MISALPGLVLCFLGVAWQQQPPPPPTARSEPQAAAQQGVQIEAKGPIHEAFAEPSQRDPKPSPPVPKEPPKPIEELPPDQGPAGSNVHWIPGYWAWNDDTTNFIWVSGIYREIPPGRYWVPGYWTQVQGGWEWISGYWADSQVNATQLLSAPPEPLDEAVPPAPDNTSVWIPGCWSFRENRYLWRTGFWTAYREGWIWTPDAYVWTPGGYIFVDGYWDHPFQDRGLLFAPVRIAPEFWNRPGWYYRPEHVVSVNYLLGGLFVRPAYAHYYFGDYFDPRYERRGFVAWTNYHVGRGIDPLAGYYRVHFHDHPNWEAELKQRYFAHREMPGRPGRPPVGRVAEEQARHEQGIVHLNRADKSFGELRHFSKPEQTELHRSSTAYRDFSRERSRLEAAAPRATPEPRREPGVAPRPTPPPREPATHPPAAQPHHEPAAAPPRTIQYESPNRSRPPIAPHEAEPRRGPPPARPTAPKPAEPPKHKEP
jgi:hypothetical protein